MENHKSDITDLWVDWSRRDDTICKSALIDKLSSRFKYTPNECSRSPTHSRGPEIVEEIGDLPKWRFRNFLHHLVFTFSLYHTIQDLSHMYSSSSSKSRDTYQWGIVYVSIWMWDIVVGAVLLSSRLLGFFPVPSTGNRRPLIGGSVTCVTAYS